jgi:hypothetical protein
MTDGDFQMATEAMTHGDGNHKSRDARKSHNSGTPKARSGSRGQRNYSLNPEWLRDFLSEMLTVEKGGVKP